ncbi:hypothetical protein H5V44_16890 [Halobellus sp. MBLA0160]|uniref:Uncharacterized protein n=1 Tax=Halobellus ruber TaxID=2761102 RepID=A0A7J9SNV3_9EURY|nr:hypothetical protein [Halobellus ruber]
MILAGVGATGAPASAQGVDTIAGTQVDPDDVSIGVELREDGVAAWTIEYRVRLDDDNTTKAFESLRADIEANDTRYVSEFRARMVATADTAENATGRQMEIRNVSVEASRETIPQEYGVLTYTFVWTNFAVVEDGSITAGDALAGFFLDGETSLQFTWPEGYGLETVQPDPDDVRTESRIVVWNGQIDFGPSEPTVIVSEGAAGGTATPADGDGGGSGDGGSDGDGSSIPAIIAAVIAAIVAGGLVYWWRGRDGQVDTPDPSGGGGAAASGATTADEPGVDATGDDGDRVAAASAGGSADEAEADADEVAGAAGADGDGEAPWEDELLSNREQVLALVEYEGGRMKQQEVAGTLEWTDAKTSQVVRRMREEGDLDAFRLGRENVLVLPDEEFGPSDEDV